MLSEQRHRMILKLLEKKRSVTVAELTELLNISESTARRDIAILDKAGRLVKVFGGGQFWQIRKMSICPQSLRWHRRRRFIRRRKSVSPDMPPH